MLARVFGKVIVSDLQLKEGVEFKTGEKPTNFFLALVDDVIVTNELLFKLDHLLKGMDIIRGDLGVFMVETAREADHLQWIIDILIDKKMANDFVKLGQIKGNFQSFIQRFPLYNDMKSTKSLLHYVLQYVKETSWLTSLRTKMISRGQHCYESKCSSDSCSTFN